MTRALRAMFFANDGLGAGHLARTLAIARALRRRAPGLEVLLATTSEADALLAAERIAAVRWPTPGTARACGWSDEARREIASRVVRAAIEARGRTCWSRTRSPRGPTGSFAAWCARSPARAGAAERAARARRGAHRCREGLSDYQLAIVPDDPTEHRPELLPMPAVRVPPITLFEAHEAVDREAARARLGLPRDGRLVLVCSGGGGDAEAGAQADRIAAAIARLPGGAEPVVAVGPLARGRRASGIRQVTETPLQPLLAAFDGAVAPAGYNLAHELAKAGVPLALFAMPRPFDDQAGRAARFEAAGLGRALARFDDADVADAVAWMARAPRPAIAAGGADRAVDALLELVGREAA